MFATSSVPLLQRAFNHKPEIGKTTTQDPQQEPSVFFHKRQADIPSLDKKIADFLPQNEALNLRLVNQRLKKNLDFFGEKNRIVGFRYYTIRTGLSFTDRTILAPHDALVAHLRKLSVTMFNLETQESFDLKAYDFGKKEFSYPSYGEFTFDGKFFLRCGDRTKIWDVATQRGTEDFSIQCEYKNPNSLFFIEQDTNHETMQVIEFSHRVFISRPQDESTDIYDLESKTKIQTLRTERTALITSALAISSNRMITFSIDQKIKIWDLQEGIVIQSIPWTDRHPPNSIQITSDETLLIVCTRYGLVKVIDVDKGEELCTLIANADHHTISSVIVPDSKVALTFRSEDSKINVWNLLTGEKSLTFSEHKSFILSVMPTSDGRIVSCSKDKAIKVWDWKTGKVLHTLAQDNTATLEQAIITSNDQLVAQFYSPSDGQNHHGHNYSEVIAVWDLKKSALGSD